MTYVSSAGWDVIKSVLCGDGQKVGLKLLGGDLSNSISRVLGWLQREQVCKKTSNMWRGHGGTRDGVDGVLATDPGGLDVQTWGEDVVALAIVGEVGTGVLKSGRADGDRLLSGSWGVVAGVGIVITGGNSEVDAGINGSIDSGIKSWRLATAQAHVGSGSLEALVLAVLGRGHLGGVRLSGILNTLDDVGHGAGAVGAENLDSNNIGLLGYTVLLASDSARAVSAVAVAILVRIVGWDGLAPGGTTLKVNVGDVGAGVNDVHIDTLTAVCRVQILVECAEVERLAVRDTGETPRSVLLRLWGLQSVDLLVLLDVLDLCVMYCQYAFRKYVRCVVWWLPWPCRRVA